MRVSRTRDARGGRQIEVKMYATVMNGACGNLVKRGPRNLEMLSYLNSALGFLGAGICNGYLKTARTWISGGGRVCRVKKKR